jgi:DNA-binding NarL/FixJ family response regulator
MAYCAENGGTWFSDCVTRLNTEYDVLRASPGGRGTGELSQRELEVATLFCRGRTVAEVATELCVAEETVATHRKRIFKKAQVHSKVQLLRWMLTYGLFVLGEE